MDQHREKLPSKNIALLLLKFTHIMNILNVMKLDPSVFTVEGNFLSALLLFVLLD